MKRINRRQFIGIMAGAVLGIFTKKLFATGKYYPKVKENKTAKKEPLQVPSGYQLSIIKGKDHSAITRRAVDALGGMGKFVKPGHIVVVKPNMSWDRTPQQAANTNPAVVKEVVEMCFEAGAKKVKVFDRTCANAQRSYKNSGVADAAREAGADVFHPDEWNYVEAEFDYSSPLQGWPIYRDAVTADCFINIPILKHHSLAKLTLSMKNLMGIMGGNRGRVHWQIATKLAHLTDFISPDLTIMDATRVLLRNGPSGGNLEDVEILDTVLAGTDPVLVDSESARFIGKNPLDIGYIAKASEMNLGNIKIDQKFIVQQTI